MPDENGEPTKEELAEAARVAKARAQRSINKAAARGNKAAGKMQRELDKERAKEARKNK